MWMVERMSMEHEEFLSRAVARFHRSRRGLSNGVPQRSAARGCTKERPVLSLPR